MNKKIEMFTSRFKQLPWPIKGILFLASAYVLIFLIYMVNKPQDLRANEQIENLNVNLNNLMLREEDYRYLLQMDQRGLKGDPSVLKEYRDYFQIVVDHVPNQWDSYAMLGYCQYQLGQEKEATAAYTAAIQSNPQFMWSYYNLAAIYFNQGQYEQAAALIQQALKIPPQSTGQSIASSNRIYMLILQQISSDFSQAMNQCLENQRERAVALLQKSLEHLKGSNQDSESKIALKVI